MHLEEPDTMVLLAAVAAIFFCCKKCWSIHPHFSDNDNIYLGGIIIMHVWSTSSGVGDDCLGRRC